MRLLIYLLAMLTGFSAAEAARPVVAAPASVDAAVASYAAAVKVAETVQVRAVLPATVSVALSVEPSDTSTFVATPTTTPVLRHDVILG